MPSDIIRHRVWLYSRVTLRSRDGQALLRDRGIDVSHAAIRQWCRQLGQDSAKRLRHRRAQPGDKWHLDAVFLTINGQRHSRWRAVAQDENVLAILGQSRRTNKAAKTFLRTRLQGLMDVPRVLITDPLQSYGAAKRARRPGVAPRQSR